VVGVRADDMLGRRFELLNVQPAARPFAEAFQAVFGAYASYDPQEHRLVDAMVVQQWRVRAGDRNGDHLADAERFHFERWYQAFHLVVLPARLEEPSLPG
jgi:hypothetical protein